MSCSNWTSPDTPAPPHEASAPTWTTLRALCFLQLIYTFSVLGGPNLDTIHRMWSNKCWVKGHNPFPWSGCAPVVVQLAIFITTAHHWLLFVAFDMPCKCQLSLSFGFPAAIPTHPIKSIQKDSTSSRWFTIPCHFAHAWALINIWLCTN